jgi:hypothetical protein
VPAKKKPSGGSEVQVGTIFERPGDNDGAIRPAELRAMFKPAA